MDRVLLRCVLLLTVAAGACKGDGTGPAQARVQVSAAGGDRQYGVTGALLAEPLQVVVFDALTEQPVENVEIQWSIVEGAGASLTAATSASDNSGIASTQLRLGPQVGVVRVQARARSMIGQPAAFEAHAVLPPVIESIQPGAATAGQTITIIGRNFSPDPDENSVLFGGLRGVVTAATETRLSVVVPQCVPSRPLAVRVHLGAVASAPATLQATAAPTTTLQLDRGQARLFADPSDLSCLRLPAQTGLTFLLVPQNAALAAGVPMRFELRGITAGGIVTAPPPAAHLLALAASSDWELALRARETELFGGGPDVLLAPYAAPAQVQPEIGERRDFNVLAPGNQTTRITAEIVAISTHAIVYRDLEAPTSGGFTAAEFDAVGRLFDDPIRPTVVDVFGSPSDVDGNARIIILFTPRVNALTPASDESFIAGYFFGCDLVAAARCPQTNRAEIFYSMVPDPDGRFSGRRTKSVVLRTVPGVLAHEFQHMINFARKNESLDALWLSEGLAHAAEDIVGDVFLARADSLTAADFKLPNFTRAHRYLGSISATSLIAAAPPGTLEMRGGAWLFVKYITAHFGGNSLLGRLTSSSRSGVDNVTAETAESWSALLSSFAVALWADGAPELQGATVPARLTFPNLDVRRVLGQFQGGFALRPRTFGYQDFLIDDRLPTASQDYVLVQAGSSATPLGLTMTGAFGGPFAELNAAGQVTILRVR